MRIDRSFLHSKVARRVLLLFVLCALLPVGALAVMALTRVTKELEAASGARLQRDCKSRGMSIVERVNLLAATLKATAANVRSHPSNPAVEGHSRCVSVAVRSTEGGLRPLFGPIPTPPPLTAAQHAHLTEDMAVLSHSFGTEAHIFLTVAIDAREPHKGSLVAEIDHDFLFALDGMAPFRQIDILDDQGRHLGGTVVLPPEVTREPAERNTIEWSDGSEIHVAAHWPIFFKAAYTAPSWHIVLSESKAAQLAPTADFERTFYLVILLSIWIVILLSLVQIRRTLGPIEVLRDATTRITAQDFDHRVSVTSGDEFQELGDSYNTMAERLGRQFRILTTREELQRTILASLDTARIVQVALGGLPDIIACDGISITLLDFDSITYRTFLRAPDGSRQELTGEFYGPDIAPLQGNVSVHMIDEHEPVPVFLEPLMEREIRRIVALPVFVDRRVPVVVAFGYHAPTTPAPDDLQQARQFIGQMVVGLANAHLVEELDQLNWGTLAALARAIDAKSAWTMGHSDRVTEVASQIGLAMNLPTHRLLTLRRGTLLHDIGKIGTPGDLLNKPGPLTAQEISIMQDHVLLGARILEPIPQFKDALPVVLEHHERFDGNGYPNGLAGEEISLEARIVAVADCYDALTSERPYRPGLDRETVVEIIRDGAGTHFDPDVVEAFLRVIEDMQHETELAAVDSEGLRR